MYKNTGSCIIKEKISAPGEIWSWIIRGGRRIGGIGGWGKGALPEQDMKKTREIKGETDRGRISSRMRKKKIKERGEKSSINKTHAQNDNFRHPQLVLNINSSVVFVQCS